MSQKKSPSRGANKNSAKKQPANEEARDSATPAKGKSNRKSAPRKSRRKQGNTATPAKSKSNRKSAPSKTNRKRGKNSTSSSKAERAPDSTAVKKRFPIVAVGASAGGLEALRELFAEIPPDCGAAFVVVTHVKPGRESALPQLLGAVTPMSVVGKANEMRLAPNQIVVAKDSMLELRDGVLRHASVGDQPEITNHPIDHFFRSLAEDQGEWAVGVILSGSGNDGMLGVKAIKAAAGTVMVQEPDSARYPGMPEAARSTELIDRVLPPADLAADLTAFCRRLSTGGVQGGERTLLPNDVITAILVRLRTYGGHDFTSYKRSTVSRRIERRMHAHRIDEPRNYLRLLGEDPREARLLLKELLISVTNFFRDPQAFQALADKGLPLLIPQIEEGRRLRVWIPGCATGEEAYSLAILIHEALRPSSRPPEVQIYATDLDSDAINVARKGMYPLGVAADIPSEHLAKHFIREEGCFRVNKTIRDSVVFSEQNLISDPPFSRINLVVCRNLLIYLNSQAQEKVFAIFHYALCPGGLLFLGTSESVGPVGHLFEVIDNKHKLLRRRAAPASTLPSLSLTEFPDAKKDDRTPPPSEVTSETNALVRRIERWLMNRYAPCSVVVDETGRVVYIHGPSGKYLEPEQGEPRNLLVEMARPGLRRPLSHALRQVAQRHEPSFMRRLPVSANDDEVLVDLSVQPLDGSRLLSRLRLITLEPAGKIQSPAPRSASGSAADATPNHDQSRADLENELRHTQENLQTTIEELETTNEELRSSNEELASANEELQSGNEELESSKEEMQSLNEELNTVNAELQAKIEALSKSSDDLSNVLNNLQIAAIFLNDDLRVQRYTEKAKDMVRLIGTDIGRPLSDLTSNLEDDTLTDDCRRVLNTLIPQEREVRDQEGNWYLTRVQPYRTSDNVIDGVVLTIADIGRAIRAERQREFFVGIVNAVRHPLLTLDGNLRIKHANDVFHATLAIPPEETLGKRIYELGDGQWDIPELRRLLEDVLPNGNAIKDFRLNHDFPSLGPRSLLLNAVRIQANSNNPEHILLGLEDVTDTGEPARQKKSGM